MKKKKKKNLSFSSFPPSPSFLPPFSLYLKGHISSFFEIFRGQPSHKIKTVFYFFEIPVIYEIDKKRKKERKKKKEKERERKRKKREKKEKKKRKRCIKKEV